MSSANLQQQIDALTSQRSHDAENADAFFLVAMAGLVQFMQIGFILRECGAVRIKNATSVLLRGLLCTSLSVFVFWTIGFGLAFGDGNFFLGENFFASAYTPEERLPNLVFYVTLSAVTSSIVAGALAERCRLVAHVLTTTLLTGFVYPCVCHWAWAPEGWLKVGINVTGMGNVTVTFQIYHWFHWLKVFVWWTRTLSGSTGWIALDRVRSAWLTTPSTPFGMVSVLEWRVRTWLSLLGKIPEDYGGSGVIHLTAGTMALIGCLLLGPRIGRFDECGEPKETPVHSTPLTALGGFFTIIGFLGLITGSLGHVTQPRDGATIGLVGTNLLVSGSVSVLTVAITQSMFIMATRSRRRMLILDLFNGVSVGMVAVSAGANAVHPWSAAVIGLVAGFAFLFWSWFFLKFKVDDPLEVISVHVGGGLWGLLAAPIFRKTDGILFTWSNQAWTAFAWNLAGALAIILWTMVFSVILFGVLFACKLLRVNRETEKRGLDSCYREPAYGDPGVGDFCHKHHHHHSHHQHENRDHVYKPSHSTSYPRGMYGSGPPLRWKY